MRGEKMSKGAGGAFDVMSNIVGIFLGILLIIHGMQGGGLSPFMLILLGIVFAVLEIIAIVA